MIRVLLVEDHAAFRQPLAFVMEREVGLTVVAQAGSLAEARRMLHGIDVAVVDLNLPDGDGVELVRELRAGNPYVEAIVLTASAERTEHARAAEAGAAAVMQKSAGIAEIITAVRRVHQVDSSLNQMEVAFSSQMESSAHGR